MFDFCLKNMSSIPGQGVNPGIDDIRYSDKNSENQYYNWYFCF